MHVQMITPTAFDWDQDGDFDLIVGDEDGRVALVENSGHLMPAYLFFMPGLFSATSRYTQVWSTSNANGC